MSKLLFVSGSLRRDSFNTRLLRFLAQSLAERCGVDFLEPAQVDLPFFDEDLETQPALVERVAALHHRFQACDGLVVASPEYNGQPTAYLKNLIDWISRWAHIDPQCKNPFPGRTLLLCSASTGWSGGAVALPQARALFAYVGCLVAAETICVPYADQVWMENQFSFDPFFEDRLHAACESFLQVTEACLRIRCERHEMA